MKVFDKEFFRKHSGGISAEEIDFWVRVCNEKVNEVLAPKLEKIDGGNICGYCWDKMYDQGYPSKNDKLREAVTLMIPILRHYGFSVGLKDRPRSFDFKSGSSAREVLEKVEALLK